MFEILPFEPRYRDDVLFCFLLARDALGRNPSLDEELLDIPHNYLARGDGFWVAVADGRVVGMLGARAASADALWLKRLYIKPDWKGRGVGSALLSAAERHARDKGISRIHTRFADDYKEAARFYPARGFVEADRSDGLRHLVKRLD